ncbi:MAG: hypothetical protein H6868_03915 [Rhodospirillales bacterium]|nr:hypothetical protein [Rhodospirillales bacterium]
MLYTIGRGMSPAQRTIQASAPSGPTAAEILALNTYDLDFVTGTYTGGSLGAYLLQNRGYNARYDLKADGTYQYNSGSVLHRTDRGLWVINDWGSCLKYTRDLTNALWAKTNMTVAKNVTGYPNNDANGACQLTATANNATAIQNISSANPITPLVSVFIKRISGSGTVELLQDDGVTWEAVTITGDWQRFEVTKGGTPGTNHYAGIRLGTSGDVVTVDYFMSACAGFKLPPTYRADPWISYYGDRPTCTVATHTGLGTLLKGAFGFYMEIGADRDDTSTGFIVSDSTGGQGRINANGSVTFENAMTSAGEFIHGWDTVNKIAGFIDSGGNSYICANGNAVASGAGSLASAATHFDFGTNGAMALCINGYFPRMTFFADGVLDQTMLPILTA